MNVHTAAAALLVACLLATASARTEVEPYALSTCNSGCYSDLRIYSSGFGQGKTRRDAISACQTDCSTIFDIYYYQDSDTYTACLALCGVQPQLRSLQKAAPETCQLCPDATAVISDCSSRIEEQVKSCKARCKKAVIKKSDGYISFASKATTTQIRYDGDKSQCDDEGYGYYY
mmetsp:Transcript_8213/g.24708  ORF Transcript_8213/g.24708 Transcript_8213/m.24708 type:complete len:174 (-) Transcript_8213:67-588(-)